jgi:release factor glutamine methyltransferase
MTIKEALSLASNEINKKEARILLSYFLQKDNLYILMNDNHDLNNPQEYFKLIQRAKNSEPIEYITNKVSFYSEEFFIDYGALIPRPESEILIDKTLEIIDKSRKLTVAEIGVGSGIISIILALKLENIDIIATDISQKALKIAKINAKKFGVEKRIKFIHTSYLNLVNEKLDIIVSNPPYIADDFHLDENVHYEPQNALFGGVKGDEMLKTIIDLAVDKNVEYLVCEMGYDQKNSLSNYMDKKNINSYQFYKDLADFDRGFIVKIGENH